MFRCRSARFKSAGLKIRTMRSGVIPKTLILKILSPETLLREQAEPINPETRVGERRFHAEVEKASEFLIEKKGWQSRGDTNAAGVF